jgi:hypothetical protein
MFNQGASQCGEVRNHNAESGQGTMAPGLHRPTRRSTHAPFHHHLLRGGRFASLGLIAFLVACGGGGGSGGGGGGDPITHTVTASAGTGGSISPQGELAVPEGETTEFTVTPDPGYSIGPVTGTCGGSLSGNTYTTNPITADCTVTATFEPAPPAATYGVGVTADGIVAHHDGDVQKLRLTLNEEHELVLDETDNGNFRSFENVELVDGDAYEIVVSAHPFNQLCTVVNGEGTVDGDEVTDPEVRCQTTLLNDTGISLCADGDTNNLGCPVAGYPSQDGDLGRDAAARDGTLTRRGGGAAGFDYTKIDAGGNELPAGATEWSCVLDNVTGRMWEVKVNDETSLRHKDWTYTWYNSDGTSNGGNAGTENGGTCLGDTGCDTEKFVAAVNTAELCGFSDWRMPTRNELLSIVHNGIATPAFDEDYFPNASSSALVTNFIWSSTPFASGTDEAWTIGTTNGHLARAQKTNAFRIRLVREAQ